MEALKNQLTDPEREFVVLAVDDDPAALRYLERIVKREGYIYHGVADGDAALAAVTQHQPDLVLLDVMIPAKDGFEVCELVRGDETTRHLPVLLITALNSRDDRVRGIEAGCTDFISKPIDAVELRARMRSLIQTKRMHDFLVSQRDDMFDSALQLTSAMAEQSEELGRELERLEKKIEGRSHVLQEIEQTIGDADSALAPLVHVHEAIKDLIRAEPESAEESRKATLHEVETTLLGAREQIEALREKIRKSRENNE